MAANETTLSTLHEVLARDLIQRIEGVEVIDGEGNKTLVRASAAELSVAATFLKNNNVTSAPEESGAVSELTKMMKAKRERRPVVLPDSLEHLPGGMH
jgi:uncharacterized protein YqeY